MARTNAPHIPAGAGRESTSSRLALYDDLDRFDTARDHYTPADRATATGLEAAELLREFLATEI